MLDEREVRVMEQAVIVSAVRTPVGTFGGYFKDVPATELGSHAIRAALERAEVSPEEVEEVLLGCVLQAGLGQNAARQAAIGAGLPVEVPATTINMLCGSGLKSVTLASQIIRAGDAEIIVAGGMENMTRAPYLVPSGRFGARMGDTQMIDSMVHDGLMDAFEHVHMGITAENVAEDYGITREDQDEFAAQSQQKAERAIAQGISRRRSSRSRCRGRRARRGSSTTTSIRAPARPRRRWASCARRSCKDGGTVTAGNASGLNDGASAIVVMSQRMAQERGFEPLGVVESYASVGVEPRVMGIGPITATRKALAKVGLGDRGRRSLRAQRGLRGAVARRAQGAGVSRGPRESARRRDRARPPDRGQRRAHPGHAAARDEARAPAARRRHAVRRWRTGTGRRDPQRGERRVARPGAPPPSRAASRCFALHAGRRVAAGATPLLLAPRVSRARGRRASERAARMQASRRASIEAGLDRRGWLGDECRQAPAAALDVLTAGHRARHVEEVRSKSASCAGLDDETVFSPGTL